MLIRTPNELGALIRDQRRRCKWDQQALAKKIGVSRQWVVEIEKGKPGAEVGLVLRALQALDIPLSVAGGSDEARKPDEAEIDIDQIIAKARRRPR
jgi:HTH-type transcriptional regulator / antitoxin HipB